VATSITPKVYGPDGVLRETLLFSTTVGDRFFTGTVDPSTVDMEVSVAGGAYTRDPDYVVFDGTKWTVPNPEAFPDGLPLDAGSNTILVRAITGSGSVSSPATIVVRLVQEADVSLLAAPPTNVSVEQFDGSVVVTVDAPADATNFRGINYYASAYEGGGVTGYTRVNLDLVDSGTTVEETATVQTLEIESDVLLNGDGTPAADPLYVEYVGRQVDADDVVLQADFAERVAVPETATKLRSTLTLETVSTSTQYGFEHSRTATRTSTPPTVYVGAFASTPTSDPLYYVTTAVYFDPVTLVEVESSYSAEVVGRPLTVSTVVGSFPVVGRQQIVRNTIESIFRSNPQVRVDPGSVLRDTFIDPFSSEAERLRFIVDFLHRAQSFAGLLAVDDPSGTGESAPVSTSAYKMALKKAFGLTRDTDVQAVIDRAFESLASNYGIFRRSGKFARGEVTFYTTKRPTSTILIPLGTLVSGGSTTFKVLSATSIPFANLARFYDPTSGRYQVTVSVQATTVGASGNVAANQVRKVVSGVSGVSVVNNGSMFGGDGQETNLELATRAQNALASVDSGTARGYLQTAADVPGVLQAEVVSAGDALMLRDLDAAGVHRGGKVDVWVQGENLASVTDSFSFARDVAKDVHFVLVGNPADLVFRAVDPALSAGLPIVEMLDDESQSLGLRNASTGEYFDLTDVAITSYDTIRLSTDVVQPAVSLADVVLGDYRRLTGNTFVFSRQPVRAVTSVTGTVSGTLPASAYRLVHPSDPLGVGRSALAGDYLEITPVDDGSGGLLPSGESVPVTDEEHTLIGAYPEYLDNIGANPLTIVVKSFDGLTTYRGPNDPSGVSDYTILDGDETNPYAIVRVPTGDIASGETVLVSYEHDENFTVAYTTNVIVSVTQAAVEARRHATADVLVKDSVKVPVDIAATVLLVQGSVQPVVDSALRTNLANLFARFRLGDSVRQDDVIAVIKGTPGVSYVQVPLTLMVRQEGSTFVRDALTTEQAGDVTYLAGLSSATVSVWLIEQELSAATTTGGGDTAEFRGVFQDDLPLVLLTSASSTALGASAGNAFIVGSDGLAIEGYSDDTTLSADGYATTAEIQARRVELTANRVLVSTSVDDSPTAHAYGATYVVGFGTGADNILTNPAEYLAVGNVEFTFDEDR
jgi:hypothetical protein